MGWDQLNLPHTTWNAGYDLKVIQQLSNERLAHDSTFKLIKITRIGLPNKMTARSLCNWTNTARSKNHSGQHFAQNEALLKLETRISMFPALPNEENRWASDPSKQERFNPWLKSLRKDIYLDQAVKVMNDVIMQQNLAKGKTGDDKKPFSAV